MKNHTKIKIILLTIIAIVSLSSGMIIYPAYTTNTTTVNPNCLDENTIHKSASFQIKEPSLLPAGYKFQCGVIESHQVHLIYSSQTLSRFGNNDSTQVYLDQQMNNGSISVDIIDMKGMMGDAMFASQIGDTDKKITDIYRNINQKNPMLHAEILQINGKTAWANDSCNSCGQQIAYFSDGTIIRHAYNVPARIQFYDENGVLYTFESNIQLENLKKIVESLK